MSIETLQVQLNTIQIQLSWLEREIALLRDRIAPVASASPPPTFESLRGIWAGVVFNEQDLQASRLQLPEGL